MSELKPCPFCGRTDALHFDRYRSDGEWWGYIECTECIMTGPVGKLKQDAIDAWNQRVNNEKAENASNSDRSGGRRINDLISREAALDEISTSRFLGEAYKKVRRIPLAKSEQKKGRWIYEDDSLIHGRCSECGMAAYYGEDDIFGANYCPNCGAKMEG